MRAHLKNLCSKSFPMIYGNAMKFVPYNYPLKIWESIETLNPQVGAHLGVWAFTPSHYPKFLHFPKLPGAWNVILKLHS
jgi:hypothetical protein